MNKDNIEEILKNIGTEEIPADVHKIAKETSNNFSSSLRQTGHSRQRVLLEHIMKSGITKLAAAAVITIAFVQLFAIFLDSSVSSAYGIEQSIRAIKNIRYMHIIQRDRAGNIEDERWIEIGPDGVQARYRQDTPVRSFFVVDDRKTVFAHYADKNTVVLYDPNDRWWRWHYAPGKLFEQIAADGADYYTIAENVRYKGRPAHHLRWAVGGIEIYIDPETKLPIAHGGYEIDYEAPPEGTFDIVIPDGVILVDRRAGAEPVQDLQWMTEEERKEDMEDFAIDCFKDARRALAGGDYVKAAELFTRVVEIQPHKNWAWFWLGRAHYELGEYDLAVREFSRVFELFGRGDFDLSYCHLARGLAFKAMDDDNMANRDFSIALPVMIDALTNIERTAMFEYADDPMFRSKPEDKRPGPKQRQWSMIKRLREVTGQNFGYHPDATLEKKEQAIAAWEEWHKNSGKIKFGGSDTEIHRVPKATGGGDE